MAEKSAKDMIRLKNIVGKVEENVKIELDKIIQEFLGHKDVPEVQLPKNLSNIQRAYVHYQATKNGLQSFSTGAGVNRQLTLRRIPENAVAGSKSLFLSHKSLRNITGLLEQHPTLRNSSALTPEELAEGGPSLATFAKRLQSSRLSNGPHPTVPRRRKSDAYLRYRENLPIWNHRGTILEAIEKNPVVFIKGSTGCGKTTQVGQFILDHAQETSKKVRVICTVPRRIAAVTVSDRVAVERGEPLGQVIGYQIRLESRTSPTHTLLTFCTSGVLLRSLSAPDYAVLQNTTHIIIDEIHERDRQTDFLITCLREITAQFPHVRLIIMGADMNTELFASFFKSKGECPIIHVEGRLYPVEEYFLEDILEMIRYENNDMKFSRREVRQKTTYDTLVEKLACVPAANYPQTWGSSYQLKNPNVDDLIKLYWCVGDQDSMEDFIDMVQKQHVGVDYQHSDHGVTMLMAAAARGNVSMISTLLNLNADTSIKSKVGNQELTAVDWARDHEQHQVVKLLLEQRYKVNLKSSLRTSQMEPQKAERLARYLSSVDEERVDLMLVIKLLHYIHYSANPSSAVLVFLPGYDEIVTLKHLILTDREFRHGSFVVFMLHSNIQTGDQKAAFATPPKGMRKIVLSTNIAETSLTIEDVVYVIDSGKAKEKSFDSLTGVTQLKSTWISKASVNQRRGRAGRCKAGVCYHLFSYARYESFIDFPIPEIVRSSLQELCLHARSYIKDGFKIEQFFSRIPEPPAPIAVKKSVELLTIMGALDKNQQLTRLGQHLLDFPLDPFLGKALLYAIVFRCLDPVLTLVSVISYRDPFQLPSDPSEKQAAHECRVMFSKGSFSDHMAYLKAFQDWEKSKMFREGTERKFCRDNYLSSITFEMIYAVRAQLLGQLRASGFVSSKGINDVKELNSNSGNWALVKGILVATLYPNICGVDKEKNSLFNGLNTKLSFHPSTTLTKAKKGVKDVPTEFIVFDEMVQQGPSNVVKGCTCVSTVAVALFGGRFNLDEGDENVPSSSYEQKTLSSTVKINQWIALEGPSATVQILKYLRAKIRILIMKRLETPSEPFNAGEEALIQGVASLLLDEDQVRGFNNVEGIDQWPKLVGGNLMTVPIAGYDSNSVGQEDILYHTQLGDLSQYRYIIAEMADFSQIVNILENQVWLMPEKLKAKLAGTDNVLKNNVIVFLWVPSKDQFVCALHLDKEESFSFLSEVPFEVVSQSIVRREDAEQYANFTPISDLVMDGLELEFELGAALLRMFLA